ncbi:threonine synthase, partial [Enterococcus faecalis]
QDGVFIEPGSAASLAGVIQHDKSGKIKAGETVVAVFSGNGLKDPDTAMETEVNISKMSDVVEKRLHLRKGVATL